MFLFLPFSRSSKEMPNESVECEDVCESIDEVVASQDTDQASQYDVKIEDASNEIESVETETIHTEEQKNGRVATSIAGEEGVGDYVSEEKTVVTLAEEIAPSEGLPASAMEPSRDKEEVRFKQEGDVDDTSDQSDAPSARVKPSLDREVLFDDSIVNVAFDNGSDEAKKRVQGYTNQLWNSSVRELRFSGSVMRHISQEGRFFWQSSSEGYEKRMLAIYSCPDLILVLREPRSLDEVLRLLPLNAQDSSADEMKALVSSFYVAESVIDPKTCKLRLSQLTTKTSIPHRDLIQSGVNHASVPKGNDLRKQSCFELVSPLDTVSLSAVVSSPGDEPLEDDDYSSVNALTETTRFEDAITNELCLAYTSTHDGDEDTDETWKHQILLGTLHSFVLSGNDKNLKNGLDSALQLQKSKYTSLESDEEFNEKLGSAIVDNRDDNWLTPLHHACGRRSTSSVSLLVNAGANVLISTIEGKTPLHISAELLDDKSLSVVLSANYPTRPE